VWGIALSLGLVVTACSASIVTTSAARPDATESAGGEIRPPDPTAAPPFASLPTVAQTPTAEPVIVETIRPRRAGVDAYRGLGAWVDVFDWAPAYAGTDGPTVTPDDLKTMAEMGVATIYFQTSRIDDVGNGTIEAIPLVIEFLEHAHALDMKVIGWFLPKWEDANEDLARLTAIADFDQNGQQFDGVAVDIEGVPTPEQREDWNLRLIALSEQLRDHLGERALGAIVLPPSLMEVVNPEYWPNFPWTDLAPLYDVWMPMSYWSFRSDDSPFAGGYAYNTDATQRLRVNIDDDTALVHAIGGIGAVAVDVESNEPLASVEDLDDFIRSAIETDAIGASIYDWASQDLVSQTRMAELVRSSPFQN